MRLTPPAILAICLLAACQTAQIGTGPSQQAQIRSIYAAQTHHPATGQASLNGDTLSLNLSLPPLPLSFKTQKLDLSAAVKIKATVTDSHNRSYAAFGADGNGEVNYPANGQLSLQFKNLLPDPLLLVELKATQTGRVDIPQTDLALAFRHLSTTDKTLAAIDFLSTAVAKTLKDLLAKSPERARSISLPDLESLIQNRITSRTGTAPDYTYTSHPSLVKISDLGTSLVTSDPSAIDTTAATTYRGVGATVKLTITGLQGADKLQVQLSDAATGIKTDLENTSATSLDISRATPGTGLKLKVTTAGSPVFPYSFSLNPPTLPELMEAGEQAVSITARRLQGHVIDTKNVGGKALSSMANAGDFNGDGKVDLILGASSDNASGGSSSVVFGGSLTDISLNLVNPLTAAQGIVFKGQNSIASGVSVAAAGDVNGDGRDDLIIGGWGTSTIAGKAFVIYGGTVTGASLNLDSITAAQGFALNASTAIERFGISVASAGDFNGDGKADLIIGALGDNTIPGKTYLIYGGSVTGSSLNLADLTAAQGFVLNGLAANDAVGCSVASAGDVNGDGKSDLIIGARNASNFAGKAYVIYGGSVTGTSLNLADLTASQGFVINGQNGERTGFSVAGAGDINGDGKADFLVSAHEAFPNGTRSGKIYLIYGGSITTASFNLSSLTTAQGFVFHGQSANELAGYSVAGAGDVNGDGKPDLIIGAPEAVTGPLKTGRAYVVYGGNFTGSSLNLGSLTAAQGFVLNAREDTQYIGQRVASAGDVNGDGKADLLIGTRAGGKHYLLYGGTVTSNSFNLWDLE